MKVWTEDALHAGKDMPANWSAANKELTWKIFREAGKQQCKYREMKKHDAAHQDCGLLGNSINA